MGLASSVLVRQGDMDGALGLARGVVKIMEKHCGSESIELAKACSSAAIIESSAGCVCGSNSGFACVCEACACTCAVCGLCVCRLRADGANAGWCGGGVGAASWGVVGGVTRSSGVYREKEKALKLLQQAHDIIVTHPAYVGVAGMWAVGGGWCLAPGVHWMGRASLRSRCLCGVDSTTSLLLRANLSSYGPKHSLAGVVLSNHGQTVRGPPACMASTLVGIRATDSHVGASMPSMPCSVVGCCSQLLLVGKAAEGKAMLEQAIGIAESSYGCHSITCVSHPQWSLCIASTRWSARRVVVRATYVPACCPATMLLCAAAVCVCAHCRCSATPWHASTWAWRA